MRTSIAVRLTPKKLSLLIKQSLYSACLFASLSSPLYAVEFNTEMIDAEDKQNIDLSQFEKKGYISPGSYLVSVQINKNTLPRSYSLTWIKADNESGSQLCLNKDQLAEFGFAEAFIETLQPIAQSACADLSHTPELVTRLDKASMVLTLIVPQAWMKYQAKNWTPPEYWDDGIAGLLLDYNLYASQYAPNHGDSSQNISSYGTLGFNLGAWRLRSDYQYDQSFIEHKATTNTSSLPRTYLFRPLPSLASKLTLGQYDLSSDLYDTFHFTGLSLESDEQMLPPDLRGYAPQISGIAQTNAKVTVSQNGRTLYQTTVSPGPFTISDLGNALQGQLDVTVEEEDGRKSTFQVGSASIPFLTRKGQLRYKVSTGKPTSTTHNDINNPMFLTGEASWGWLSNVSLYGGAIFTADDYQALTSGLGFNLNQFGSLSFDITGAEANLRNNDLGKQKGFSYRANYSKRFEETNSQITFAGYRFSDREYVTMSEYIDSRDGNDNNGNEKESYVLSFNQYIAPLALNTYLNITRNTYWDSVTNTNYSLSVNHSFDIGDFKSISASLAVSRVRWDNNEENQYYFSLTVPLASSRNVSYSLQRYGDDATSQTATWYDGSSRNNPWNLSVSGTDHEFSDGKSAMRGNYQHYSPYGRFNLNGSIQPSSYRSFSTSWNGSFTATRFGAALHDYSPGNSSRVMVDADGIADVEVNNNLSVTNLFGIAVVPSVGNYTTATVMVNSNKLPEGVDVNNSVIRTTLTEGAIGYMPLRAIKGYQIVGVIRLEDGHYPPLGVTVSDKDSGRDAGLVADDGYVYLSGVQENSTLTLKWADKTCEITPPNSSNTDGQAVILPCKLPH
ncbi:TPA: fimbrial biogenesis outer membrane usher protein [Kluyvera ascorbata]|uniref:Fimbrial protein n=1 Tax=Kluyvera genomosp. 2 TaxID=2774054 RepID=A0A2T2Y0N5_9ENTR|nr:MULTISPECIES: fimbria/pilus outer membrane usher protein [Enterobacteriaceae]HAT3919008.1 fimbrial biogenesis outer membrane usher protein [Kluyvera ascorbata]PSR46095.1 fimbrial protein [Kluyvera genomosp. 2]BBQ83522.1 fimbrial outer membrane usher protein StdB [Klebsiella sp. WP3-W18-ESBL-02]BBR20545.1 fimbrial outer membrane usher protein StdB [Klebsiella sp. WP3-S18-ESBL-05]HAT3943921.1 fimbrial biogenesis outer membrane usher protein [Kluyvera ascorbata]